MGGMLAISLALAISSPGVILVDEGRPKSVIVVPDAPSRAAALGAQILRDHLRQMSGAEVPIIKEAEAARQVGKGMARIYVGESGGVGELGLSSASLGPGGMVMHAAGDAVALFGTDERTPADPDGTRYAVTAFLEDVLRVRWLWPGESGKIVPQRGTIAVGEFHREFSPRLAQRRIRNHHHNDRLQQGLDNLGITKEEYLARRAAAERVESQSGDWFGWHKLGGTFDVPGGHAFGDLWAKWGRAHPEWFALQANGTRDQSRNGERARLCKSNAALIDAIAREKIAELERKPGLPGVSLSPNDGSVNSFCRCPACEALDAPGGRKIVLADYTGGGRREYEHVSLTDRMVWFWNEIAERVVKEHPDALFTVDAYSAYRSPPVTRTLHPNLVVRFVNIQYTDEELRGQGLADWEAWAKAASRIYFRPNLMLAGRRAGSPMIYVHKFGEDFRRLAANRMWGTDFDSCVHNWATQGLNYYVVARLHWDPEQNVDAIIDDYCRAGFGPSAKHVRAYFDKLEAITNDIAIRRAALDEELGRDKSEPLQVFTPEVMAGLGDILRKAREAAGEDRAVLARVAFLERGLRWTGVEVKLNAMLARPETVANAEARGLWDERHAMMRDIFENDFLAVNVGLVSWAEDGYLKRFGWRPPMGEKNTARQTK